MFQETERKFLVCGDYKAEVYESTEIRQGYLCGGSGVTVRVRQRSDKGYLTIKGARSRSGLSRFEWEKEITADDAQTLLSLVQGGLVEKTRHLARNTDGRHIWEIDEFHGANQGLVVAEIELSSENEPFDRPDWLGQEVSDDPRYYNSHLLTHPYSQWQKT